MNSNNTTGIPPDAAPFDDPFTDAVLDQLLSAIGRTELVSISDTVSRNMRRATESTRPACDDVPQKIGPYVILGPLGRGGMGSVFRARHAVLGSEAAIKTILTEREFSVNGVERFHREMRSLAALTHPNVVRAFDGGTANGVLYLAMELVTGRNLKQLAEERILSVPVCCELIRQAALGLAAIHDAGVIHRDIKPANIMLTDDGIVKLVDFGLARNQDEGSDLTATHAVVGTARYIAPEQLVGVSTIDHRCDIFSLGRTMQTLLQISGRHSMVDPQEPVRPEIPPSLLTLIGQMTHEDRTQRIQSASEVATRLTSFGIKDGTALSISDLAARNDLPDGVPHPSEGRSLPRTVRPQEIVTREEPRSFPWRIAALLFGLAILSLVVFMRPVGQRFNFGESNSSVDARSTVPLTAQTEIEVDPMPVTNGDFNTSTSEPPSERDLAVWLVNHGASATINFRNNAEWRGLRVDKESDIPADYCLIQNVQILGTGPDNARFERVLEAQFLQGLISDRSYITDDLLARLNPNWQLKWLYLPCPLISDNGIASIERFRKTLQNLDVSRSAITVHGIELLSTFPTLRELRLVDTQIKDESLNSLPQFASLVSLDVSSTAITDESLQLVAHCAALRRLSMHDTVVTDAGLEQISALPLTALDITRTRITAAAAARYRETHPHCSLQY